jgi:hypothetical protein
VLQVALVERQPGVAQRTFGQSEERLVEVMQYGELQPWLT